MLARIVFFARVISLCFSCRPDSRATVQVVSEGGGSALGDWTCTIINDGARVSPLPGFFDSANYTRLPFLPEKPYSKYSLKANNRQTK